MKKVRLVSFLLGCMLLLASFTNSHSTKELSEEEKIEHQKLVETSRLLNMPLKNPYYKVDVLKLEQADPYLGEEVIVDEWGNIHILFSADGTRLTTQESLDFYNNTMKSDGVKEIKREDGHNNTRGMVIPIELLNEPIRIGGMGESFDSPVAVTAEYGGPVTITHTISITSSDSWSGSFSASIKAKIFVDVNINFGITWSSTSSSSTSTSGSWYVPANYYGRIIFKAKRGSFHYQVFTNPDGSSYNIYCSTPIKLQNGYTDGIFDLVLRPR